MDLDSADAGLVTSLTFIRSTLRQSRPNRAGLKCPYVRTFFRPQKNSLISMKFGLQLEVDE